MDEKDTEGRRRCLARSRRGGARVTCAWGTARPQRGHAHTAASSVACPRRGRRRPAPAWSDAASRCLLQTWGERAVHGALSTASTCFRTHSLGQPPLPAAVNRQAPCLDSPFTRAEAPRGDKLLIPNAWAPLPASLRPQLGMAAPGWAGALPAVALFNSTASPWKSE